MTRWVRRAAVAVALACALACGAGPSPQAVQIARQAGLPDAPAGSGPFDGPEGSVYYTTPDGKLSFWAPSQRAIFFATASDAGPVYRFAITPEATWAFPKGAPVALGTTPPDVLQWPMAEPLITALVRAHTPTPGQQAEGDAAMAPWISARQHEITMGVLENIEAQPCVEHYDGTTFLGCW